MKVFSLILAIISALNCGCVQLGEASLPLRSSGVVRYRVVEELLVCGIKRELRSPTFDYVVLYAHPGVKGPEVVQLGILPVGSEVEILGLIRRGAGIYSDLEYRVRILAPKFAELRDRDVRVSNASAFELYHGRDILNQPILSSRYFARQPQS